jgi:hypothetical protein
LPEYLNPAPAPSAAPVAAPNGTVERRTAPPVVSSRPVQRRDFSYIKGDLVRIFATSALLVALLAVLTLVLA